MEGHQHLECGELLELYGLHATIYDKPTTNVIQNGLKKAMIKVLGRANSVNVQKVMWCAAEIDVDVERVNVGGSFGGTDSEEFRLLNPNGTVPVLVDGDFVLWESNAIVRYLCAKYGKPDWLLNTVDVQGQADQWMDWYLTKLHPPMTTLFWQLIRTDSGAREKGKIADAIDACTQCWTLLDRHFERNSFVLGDQLSMADIPVGCAAYRWHCMQFDRPDLPNLRRWWSSLVTRQAYKGHVMVPLT